MPVKCLEDEEFIFPSYRSISGRGEPFDISSAAILRQFEAHHLSHGRNDLQARGLYPFP